VAWERSELERLLRDGELEPVPSPDALWTALWSLGELPDGEQDTEEGGEIPDATSGLSDGTAIWFAATQQGRAPAARAEADGAATERAKSDEEPLTIEVVPAADLADEALRVWLHFFAGHPEPDDPREIE
jgi:hypothetical protein